MKTVSYKALDAQVGADEAAREHQLKSLGLQQTNRDRNLRFSRDNIGLQKKAFRNELSDMKSANWLGAGGAALGLGQGMVDRKNYDRLAEMLRGQQKMIAPPNYGYGYGVGNSRYGIGGE
jgi:hypothetical protein